MPSTNIILCKDNTNVISKMHLHRNYCYYKTDNLKLHLDGILNYKDPNTGEWSHSTTTTTWYNMAPILNTSNTNSDNAVGAYMNWGTTCLYMRRTSTYKPINLGYRNYANFTIEYTCIPYYTDLTGDGSELFCSFDAGGIGLLYRQNTREDGLLVMQQYNGSWKSFACSKKIKYYNKVHITYTYNNSTKIGTFFINGKKLNLFE